MATDPNNLSDVEIAEQARANVAELAASAGVTSTSVDGVTTQADAEKAIRVAQKLASMAGRKSGRRPFFRPISLRGPAE